MHRFAGALHDLLDTMQGKRDELQTAYSRMVQEPLDDVQFYNFYRQAQYASRGIANSSDQIDAMFGVTSSRRQELFKKVRDRQNADADGHHGGYRAAPVQLVWWRGRRSMASLRLRATRCAIKDALRWKVSRAM